MTEIVNYIISDGDSIHIPIRPIVDRFVRISGQVKAPGKYPFQKGMQLNELIDAAITLDDTDFMNTVDLSQIIVNRKNPDGHSPLKIKVDGLNGDFELVNGDHITISRLDQFQPIESVEITGEIKTPGVFLDMTSFSRKIPSP